MYSSFSPSCICFPVSLINHSGPPPSSPVPNQDIHALEAEENVVVCDSEKVRGREGTAVHADTKEGTVESEKVSGDAIQGKKKVEVNTGWKQSI